MGKIVKRGSRHCIQNSSNKKIGKCFSKLSDAKTRLRKAKRAACRRAGKC